MNILTMPLLCFMESGYKSRLGLQAVALSLYSEGSVPPSPRFILLSFFFNPSPLPPPTLSGSPMAMLAQHRSGWGTEVMRG